MDDPIQEVQVRLGIEIEDRGVLLRHVSIAGEPQADADQALVWALTSALDSRVFRELLSDFGIAIRRGDVRLYTQHQSVIMPGGGLDHSATESAGPAVH